MEIMINGLINDDMGSLSGSRMELGDNAASITWNNSKNAASVLGYVNDENREEVIDYFAQYGAWALGDMITWSNQELCAMIVQEVASQCREFSEDNIEEWDWLEYEEQARQGRIHGQLFKCEKGDFYIQLSH